MSVELSVRFVLLTLVVAFGAAASTPFQPTSVADEEEPVETVDLAALEDADLPLVPPYAALARSAALPGWGQFKVGQPVQGMFFGATTLGLLGGWLFAQTEFNDIFNNEYLVAVQQHGVSSSQAEEIYTRANERYKVSRFLLFSAIGVWTYSLIDAYIDANIYNAELRAERVLEQTQDLREFSISWANGAPTALARWRF